MPRQETNAVRRSSTRRPPAARREARVLRVGVIHQGRIVEERILRPGQQLSVGSSPECSVVLPPSKTTQRKFALLSAKGGRYHLNFTDAMRGKLSVGARIDTLAALSGRGLARGRRGGWSLPIGPEHRGKIYVEDHAILFQFVAPPPLPARRRSAEYRRPAFQRTDLVFVAILLFSALLHTAALLWIESQPAPKQLRFQDIEPHFVTLLLPQDPEPEPEPTPVETVEAVAIVDNAPTVAAPETAPGSSAADPAPAPAAPAAAPETDFERSERIRTEAAGKGLLMLIGAAEAGSNPTVIEDLLADANNLSGDVGKALAASRGVILGRQDDLGVPRAGGGEDGVAGQSGVGPAGVGVGVATERTRAQVGEVRSTAPEIHAEPDDVASISRTIKRYNGRIKACYERELKDDPSLAGKIAVSFEIDTSGDVSAVGIEENSTHNDDLADCIKREVRRFRFSPAPADDIEVAGYPYLLAPG